MPENRIESLTVANAATDSALAPVSPTGAAILPQFLIKAAVVIVSLAGVVVALPASGIALPPIVIGIATAVVGVGAALGIASQGARKPT